MFLVCNLSLCASAQRAIFESSQCWRRECRINCAPSRAMVNQRWPSERFGGLDYSTARQRFTLCNRQNILCISKQQIVRTAGAVFRGTMLGDILSLAQWSTDVDTPSSNVCNVACTIHLIMRSQSSCCADFTRCSAHTVVSPASAGIVACRQRDTHNAVTVSQRLPSLFTHSLNATGVGYEELTRCI